MLTALDLQDLSEQFAISTTRLESAPQAAHRSRSLRVTSPDGASIRARVFTPGAGGLRPRSTSTATPVVAILPAMGVRAAYYEPFALALAEAGCVAVTADLRGQGESDRRAAHGDRFAYRQIVDLDLPALETSIRERFPGRPLVVTAHSLGGQLAVLSTGRGRLEPDGLVLVAAGTAHWRHWPRGQRLKVRAVTRGVTLAARLLPWYPGRRLGFGGDQPRALMRDWSHNAATGDYGALEPTTQAPTPLLSLAIEGDRIAPPGAVAALCSRFESRSVDSRKLAATPGEDAWHRHFRWVDSPWQVVEALFSWWAGSRPRDAPARAAARAAPTVRSCRGIPSLAVP